MAIFLLPALSKAAHNRGIWRLTASVLTALGFLLVVSTSATHIHLTAAALQDCAVCAHVTDELAGMPVPPALVHDVQLQPYYAVAAKVHEASYSTVQLLPRNCGPPHAAV